MSEEQVRQARALSTRPDESVSSVARLLGVSRTTLYKYATELTAKRNWGVGRTGE
ncbi:helix-turn-helix domain-containing protein [Nocardia rhamnosiphila]